MFITVKNVINSLLPFFLAVTTTKMGHHEVNKGWLKDGGKNIREQIL